MIAKDVWKQPHKNFGQASKRGSHKRDATKTDTQWTDSNPWILDVQGTPNLHVVKLDEARGNKPSRYLVSISPQPKTAFRFKPYKKLPKSGDREKDLPLTPEDQPVASTSWRQLTPEVESPTTMSTSIGERPFYSPTTGRTIFDDEERELLSKQQATERVYLTLAQRPATLRPAEVPVTPFTQGHPAFFRDSL